MRAQRATRICISSDYLRSAPCIPFRPWCTLRKRHSFFEFSLCLSRACLGKMIVYIIYKWRKNGVSLPCSSSSHALLSVAQRPARSLHASMRCTDRRCCPAASHSPASGDARHGHGQAQDVTCRHARPNEGHTQQQRAEGRHDLSRLFIIDCDLNTCTAILGVIMIRGSGNFSEKSMMVWEAF
jgi:hypothetical protein